MAHYPPQPTLDQMAARSRAEDELPLLSDDAAIALCRACSRSTWLRDGWAHGTVTAGVLGLYTIPTDTDERWPVLAVSVARSAGYGFPARSAVLLLTQTEPGEWSVLEVASLASTAVVWARPGGQRAR